MTNRRDVLLGAAGLASQLFIPRGVFAASWPDRPIRAIVPFPPAGNVDITARLVAAASSASLGQQMIVDNRPGAGGNIGNEAVAKADPDGYNILFTQGGIVVNPLLYKSLKYDVFRDFAPVSLLVIVPNVLVVPSSSPAKSLAEFIAYAKTKTLLYCSAGNGTSSHLSGELLQQRIGVKFTHIPYRGTALAVTDLIAGRMDVTCDNVSALLPHIKSGALRALAVTSQKRLSILPDVPTMAEDGLSDFKSYGWTAVFAPAHTPSPVIQQLNKFVADAIRGQNARDVMEKVGNVVVGSSPAELEAFVTQEAKTWGPIIKDAHISLG